MTNMILQPTAVYTGIKIVNGREENINLLAGLSSVFALSDKCAFLDGMLDLIIHAAQAGSATYFCFDLETSDAVITAMRGDLKNLHLLGLRVNSSLEYTNPVATGTQCFTVGELYNDPPWLLAADPGEASRMHNLIVLPVRLPERSLGIIHLFNFQSADLTTLQLLADHLAFGLDQREQLLQSQLQNRRLIGLLQAISQMTGILDRNQLLQTVTEKASELLEAERSSVFIVDPETHETIYNVSFKAPKQSDLQTPNFNHNPDDKTTRQARSQNYTTNTAISAQLTSWEELENPRQDGANVGGLLVLNKRSGNFKEQDAHVLEILAEQTSALLQVAELYESSERLFLDAIRALVSAIEAKDPGTQGHTSRVSDYSVMIAQEMGLSASQINEIRISSLLHDLGKIGIHDTVLNKQGSLTPDERKQIECHPVIGAKILGQMDALSGIVPGILEHHERLDGSGYPFGLKGEQISLLARIIMVADVFDAMTSSRPYRSALSVKETLTYIQTNREKLFDSRCVQALQTILERSTSPTSE